MRRARLGVIWGGILAVAAIAACALDESGTAPGDGGGPDVIFLDGGPDIDADAAEDVTYDVPDLGVGETESGLPCTCVTSVPQGYSVVEYDPSQQANCTAGYGTPTDLIDSIQAGPAQCGCSCTGAPTAAPTCACGADPASFTLHGGMNDCTSYGNVTVKASTASCYTQSQSPGISGNGGTFMLAVPQSPCTASGGKCGPGNPQETFPDASIQHGTSCAEVASNGTCQSGVCLPSAGSGYQLCITNHTTGSCSGFTDFPQAYTVGTGVMDNRACTGVCGCGIVDAGTCGSPVFEIWNGSGNCGGTPDVVLDGGCAQVDEPNNATYNSTHYDVAQSGGTCGVVGSYNPTGGVVQTGRYVICCHP